MSTMDKYWRSIPVKYGIVLFIALAVYFLIMRALGLAENFYLRMFNIVLVYFTVMAGINRFHNKAGLSYYEDFFDFFKIGMGIGFVGVTLFSVFFAIYLDQFDKPFMEMLQEYRNFGGYFGPVSVAVLLFIEGMSSAAICSFIYIQIRKSRTIESPAHDSNELSREMKGHRH